VNLLDRTRPQLIAGVNYVTRLCGSFAARLEAFRKRVQPPGIAPHRRIVKRRSAHDGSANEIITLSCGHQYRLIHHPREVMPCEACARGDK